MDRIDFLKDEKGNLKGVIFYGLQAEIILKVRVFIIETIDALKKDFYPTFVWVTDQKDKIYGVTNIRRTEHAIKFLENCVPVYSAEHYL